MNLMLPKKMEGPWRITFDTNPDTCNLHCLMCEEFSRYRKEKRSSRRIMDIDLIRTVLESTVSHGLREVIPSTMGEPLLYPRMRDFIELIKTHDLKLNLTTNGTFPGLGAIKWGGLILPIASDVKISMNGASKETVEGIMQGIDFPQQIENIKRFLEVRDVIADNNRNRATVTFQITFMKRNLEELPELLEIAMEFGADRLKGHHLWITWPELVSESLLKEMKMREKWNDMVTILTEIRNDKLLSHGKKIVLDNVYKVPAEPDNIALDDDWLCPFLGREAWIAWDGTFNVCCAPDEHRRTLGYFGNVNEDDLIELWNSERYDDLVENWGNYEVCKRCNMRRPRGGDGGCKDEV